MAQRLPLTMALGGAGRFEPLVTGDVQPKGIQLRPRVMRPSDLFGQTRSDAPVDVSEMSLSGYLWDLQHEREWFGIPVFPGWVFSCHVDSLVNGEAGIEHPEDLRGRRVGVPEYPVTAIAWIRDAWEWAHGLRPDELIWCEERSVEASHYRPLGYRPPTGVPIEAVPVETCLSDMLVAGKLAAVTRYFGGGSRAPHGDGGDRSPLTLQELVARPGVRWLYPDRKAAALEYYRHVGWPQPIHCVVVRREVVDRDPWVPASLYRALAEAARLTEGHPSVRTSFPFPVEEQRQVLGAEFSPIGFAGRTRQMLERLLDLAAQDGFMVSARRLGVDDLFDAGILDGG